CQNQGAASSAAAGTAAKAGGTVTVDDDETTAGAPGADLSRAPHPHPVRSRRRGTSPRRASVRNTRARERPDPRRSSPAPGRRKRRRSADSTAPIRDDKVPDAPASGALSHTWGKWFRVHGGGMIGG